jgi:hypothetical protein
VFSQRTCWRPHFLRIGISGTTTLCEGVASGLSISVDRRVRAHHCTAKRSVGVGQARWQVSICESRTLPASCSRNHPWPMSATSRATSGTRVHLFSLHPSAGSRHSVRIFFLGSDPWCSRPHDAHSKSALVVVVALDWERPLGADTKARKHGQATESPRLASRVARLLSPSSFPRRVSPTRACCAVASFMRRDVSRLTLQYQWQNLCSREP